MAFIKGNIYAFPDTFAHDLQRVTDFVERHNKYDAEVEVAEAAQRINTILDANAAEDEKSTIVENLTNAQEDKLKEAHAEHYRGTDDDMPDAFEMWLENLTLEEIKEILC